MNPDGELVGNADHPEAVNMFFGYAKDKLADAKPWPATALKPDDVYA
jgi:hypothetical protein